MADIDYWIDTLTDEVEAAQALLDSACSSSDEVVRLAALGRAEQVLRDANRTKRSFTMEYRLLQNAELRRKYSGDLLSMEETLCLLKERLVSLRGSECHVALSDEADPTCKGLRERSGHRTRTRDDRKLEERYAEIAAERQHTLTVDENCSKEVRDEKQKDSLREGMDTAATYAAKYRATAEEAVGLVDRTEDLLPSNWRTNRTKKANPYDQCSCVPSFLVGILAIFRRTDHRTPLFESL